MHLRSAKLVDLKMFKQAFKASPKAAFQSVMTDESGKPSGREVAVYTNSGPAGEMVGIMTWKDALIVLADVKNYSFLEGEALNEEGELALTVGESNNKKTDRLLAKRADLQAKINKIDERLA